MKKKIIFQKSPSEGTTSDIIYQDDTKANINMAYGSSTVSPFYHSFYYYSQLQKFLERLIILFTVTDSK